MMPISNDNVATVVAKRLGKSALSGISHATYSLTYKVAMRFGNNLVNGITKQGQRKPRLELIK